MILIHTYLIYNYYYANYFFTEESGCLMPQQAGQLASKKAGKAAGTRKTDRQSRRKVQKRTKDEEFKTKTLIRADICSSSRAEIAHTINT